MEVGGGVNDGSRRQWRWFSTATVVSDGGNGVSELRVVKFIG